MKGQRFVVVPASSVPPGVRASHWCTRSNAERAARQCEESGVLFGVDAPLPATEWAVIAAPELPPVHDLGGEA